jgi:hypothetical protein
MRGSALFRGILQGKGSLACMGLLLRRNRRQDMNGVHFHMFHDRGF